MGSSQAGPWTIESNVRTTVLSAVALAGVGAAMAAGSGRYGSPIRVGDIAGLSLGVILFVLGAGTLLFGGKHTVTIDESSRSISIEHATLFGTKTRRIRFDEIADVYVGALGDTEGGSISYHVAVTLASGEGVALFAGFVDGQRSRSSMEALRDRVLASVRAEAREGTSGL